MIIDLKKIPMKYINMDDDNDKNVYMENLVSEFGFEDYERVSGIKGKNAIVGCAASHAKILKNYSSPLIILEDDCQILNNISILEVPDDSDAIYLGLSSWALNINEGIEWGHSYKIDLSNKLFFKTNNMLATHAILYINEDYKEMCSRAAQYSAENSEHVDVSFARFQRFYNVYGLSHPIFYQTSAKRASKITLSEIRMRRYRE